MHFGHIWKIHSVPARQQCQRLKDSGDDGKQPHQIILLDIDLRLICFPHLGYVIAQMQYVLQISGRMICQNCKMTNAVFGKQFVFI